MEIPNYRKFYFLERVVQKQQSKIVIEDHNVTQINFLQEHSDITQLEITYAKIHNLPLTNTVNLEYIRINLCRNLKNLIDLNNCHNIKEIEISYLNITSIAPIGSLTKLNKVAIYHCKQITDYYILEKCVNLNHINLYFTNFSDISPIANLQNLETLITIRNDLLPEQFQKWIQNDKWQVQYFLKKWRKTQTYYNYKTTKCNLQYQQRCQQLRIGLGKTTVKINQFQYNISKQIYQYNVNMIKTVKLIKQFQ